MLHGDTMDSRSLCFFWAADGLHAELSNEYLAFMKVGEVTFLTMQHYLVYCMAEQCGDGGAMSLVTKPAMLKELGDIQASLRGLDVTRWHEALPTVLHVGLTAKFMQNEALAAYLMHTGCDVLAAATNMDMIMGIGCLASASEATTPALWVGGNALGIAMMRVREALRRHAMAARVDMQATPSLPADVSLAPSATSQGHGGDAEAMGPRVGVTAVNTDEVREETFVFFWREYELHGCLSNWFFSPFEAKGFQYLWVEQHLMHSKAKLMGDADTASDIMAANDPRECKRLGQAVRPWDEDLWRQMRPSILFEGLLQKFQQDANLREMLLMTGDAILAEASPRDKVFGIGLAASDPRASIRDEWRGENLQGEVLMQVREHLREAAQHVAQQTGLRVQATGAAPWDETSGLGRTGLAEQNSLCSSNGDGAPAPAREYRDSGLGERGLSAVRTALAAEAETRLLRMRDAALQHPSLMAALCHISDQELEDRKYAAHDAGDKGLYDILLDESKLRSHVRKRAAHDRPQGAGYQNSSMRTTGDRPAVADCPQGAGYQNSSMRTTGDRPAVADRPQGAGYQELMQNRPSSGLTAPAPAPREYREQPASREYRKQPATASNRLGERGLSAVRTALAAEAESDPQGELRTECPQDEVAPVGRTWQDTVDAIDHIRRDAQTTAHTPAALTSTRGAHCMVDAFAGVSAFAAEFSRWGIQPVGFCEMDDHCQQLLFQQWMEAEICGDFYGDAWRLWDVGCVSVLVGGPSCVWATPAGKQLGSGDPRSLQIRDMARMAAHFQPHICIIENVTQLLLHTDVMELTILAFKAVGYTLRSETVLHHDDVGGATIRKRVFLWFEKDASTSMLPPLCTEVEFTDSTTIRPHLVPTRAVPTSCRVHGVFEAKAVLEATPPIIGYTRHGGDNAPIVRGSLMKMYGSNDKWRVMSRDGAKLELMRSCRSNPSRWYTDMVNVERQLWQFIPVYSIDGVSKSIRAFGEWPVRTVMLICDSRFGEDEHGLFIRPLLPPEVWSLQELAPELLGQAIQLGLTDDQLYRIAGNTIPRRLLQPIAQAVHSRLLQIDDCWGATPVPAARVRWHERHLTGEGWSPQIAVTATDVKPQTQMPTAVDTTFYVAIDLRCEEPKVMVNARGELPKIWHRGKTREWSVKQTSAMLGDPRCKPVHLMAAEYKGTGGVHRVVVTAAPGSSLEATEGGSWLPLSAINALETRPMACAIGHLVRLLETPEANRLRAHEDDLPPSGALPVTPLQGECVSQSAKLRDWNDIQRQSARELEMLRQHLLSVPPHDRQAAYLHEWGGEVGALSTADVPDSLKATCTGCEDERLATVLFSERCVPPSTTRLPRMQAQTPVPGFHPKTIHDLLLPVVFEKLIPDWIRGQLQDIKRYKREGSNAKRVQNQILAIGQEMFLPQARGKVWDLRGPTIELLDYTEPTTTHLDLDLLKNELADFPDQELLGFMCEGVQFKADLEMQIVFCPHLMSLSHGVQSVEDELKKLIEHGWYGIFDHMPFVPCRMQSQGSVARPLQPDRWRRIMEAGCPRKPVFDTSGMQVVSLNEAIKGHRSLTREQYEATQAEGVKPTEKRKRVDVEAPTAYDSLDHDANAADKHADELVGETPSLHPQIVHPVPHTPLWPLELKPRVADITHDALVLKHLAHITGEPLFAFSDDFSSFFHQFMLAPQEWWKVCVLYQSLCPQHEHHSFAVEYVLAMGVYPASNVAQRMAHAFRYMWCKRMDALEDAAAHGDSEEMATWKKQRRTLHGEHVGENMAHVAAREAANTGAVDTRLSIWRQDRPYVMHQYTDDPVFVVVGLHRTERALRVWHDITTGGRWLMSIAEKRQLGVSLKALGANLYFDANLVVIPQDKVLRAMAKLQLILRSEIQYGELRNLLGLLEHCVILNGCRRDIMYGMYGPLKGGGRGGPTDVVQETPMLLKQALRWWTLLTTTAGCHFHAALPTVPKPLTAALVIHLFSDAALLGAPVPSLGGYIHGMWWTIPLPRHLQGVPIAHLEFLAAAINIMMFYHYLCPEGNFTTEMQVVVHIDGLATPQVLTSDSAKSVMMQHIHLKLQGTEAYIRLEALLFCAHCWGEANVAADFASRGLIDSLMTLCAQLQVKPTQLAVPRHVRLFLDEVYAYGRLIHTQHDPTNGEAPGYPPVVTVVPAGRRHDATESLLSPGHSCCEAGDGPQRLTHWTPDECLAIWLREDHHLCADGLTVETPTASLQMPQPSTDIERASRDPATLAAAYRTKAEHPKQDRWRRSNKEAYRMATQIVTYDVNKRKLQDTLVSNAQAKWARRQLSAAEQGTTKGHSSCEAGDGPGLTLAAEQRLVLMPLVIAGRRRAAAEAAADAPEDAANGDEPLARGRGIFQAVNSTANVDRAAWLRQWLPFCRLTRTPRWRQRNRQVPTSPDMQQAEMRLLAYFVRFVAQRTRLGNTGEVRTPQAMLQAAVDTLRRVVREFARRGMHPLHASVSVVYDMLMQDPDAPTHHVASHWHQAYAEWLGDDLVDMQQDFDPTMGFPGEGPKTCTPKATSSSALPSWCLPRSIDTQPSPATFKHNRDVQLTQPQAPELKVHHGPVRRRVGTLQWVPPSTAKRKGSQPEHIRVTAVGRYHSQLKKLQSDRSRLALRPAEWSLAKKYLDLEHAYTLNSANANTRKGDLLHWKKYWEPFCAHFNTPVWRDDPEAINPGHDCFDREVRVSVWFLLWVWDHIQPRNKSDPQAKPASVLQVWLAIRREHKLHKLGHCLVPTSATTTMMKGMTSWFCKRFGPEALLPRRKEPIPYQVVDYMLQLPNNTTVGKRVLQQWDFLWVSLMALIATLKGTGFRKDELVKGEFTMSRASVVYFLGDSTTGITEPTTDEIKMLLATTEKVTMGVAPGPAKPDQTGERYGNFMAFLRLEHTTTNAVWRMLMMEQQFPVQSKTDRKATPLFGPSLGNAFTHSQLDHLLVDLLMVVSEKTKQDQPDLLPAEHIKRYSWHSFRIALACALKALNASDATIQALCRWASTQSLRVYARINRTDYADLVQRAGQVKFDSVQAATLWNQAPRIDDDATYIFAEAMARQVDAHHE